MLKASALRKKWCVCVCMYMYVYIFIYTNIHSIIMSTPSNVLTSDNGSFKPLSVGVSLQSY